MGIGQRSMSIQDMISNYWKKYHFRYFVTLYWAIDLLTITGYGDITPMNPFEISIAEAGMIGGIFLFGFRVEFIFEVVEEYRETALKYERLYEFFLVLGL